MNIKSKFGYLCCASLLTTSLWAQDVLISTRNTSLLLDAPVGGEVRFIYYGDKLSTSDAATLLETEQKTFSAYPDRKSGSAGMPRSEERFSRNAETDL